MRRAFFILSFFVFLAPLAHADRTSVTLGVLAFRGEVEAQDRWQPLAHYLGEQVPGKPFVLKLLTQAEMDKATADGELDFILTNPGHYVGLEAAHGVTRLATLRSMRQGQPQTQFGAVIFTRADRADLERLSDLKGKSFMAVGRDAFGGFQFAWRELKDQGLDPFRDFSRLVFAGFPQDNIVTAVRDGTVDAGTVRTDTLEQMVAEGKIKLSDFRVLQARATPGFPFSHSTRLYPEWPLAKARHTDETLAQRVAVALLNMPADHPAAEAGGYAGWTVPLDYNTVHDLFRELGVGPYARTPAQEAAEFFRRYFAWFVTGALVLLLMMAAMATVFWLNLRLRAEAAQRRHTEGRLRIVSGAVEQTTDAIAIANDKGLIEYVNPAFERNTGYAREAVLGRSLHDFPFAHDAQFCERAWETVSRGEVFRAQVVNHRADGTAYHEEKTVTPLRDENGAITHFVCAGRDITERLQAQEKEREHRAELARVARLTTLGEMASGIAHELNQPLTAIVNYAEGSVRRVKEGAPPAGVLGALNQIAQQAQRAGRIIQHMRRFAIKRHNHQAPADINGVVAQAVALLEPEANAKGIVVRLDLADNLPAVAVDGIQIEQVVLNLMRNAIEAMTGNGKDHRVVVVRTARGTDAGVEIAVRDTGPGLTPEWSPHLFDPFFTTKEGGMGLGLSISRTIVEAHGGRLTAAPNPARGATFRVTLPREEESRAH
jgi:two-component system sensor histidine kinase TtrS